jgi:hypothetical protein
MGQKATTYLQEELWLAHCYVQLLNRDLGSSTTLPSDDVIHPLNFTKPHIQPQSQASRLLLVLPRILDIQPRP